MNEIPRYSEADRIYWKTEKLKMEAEAAARPFLQTPGFWFSAVSALVAVVGIGLQSYASGFTKTLAEIESKKAEIETAKAKGDAAEALKTKEKAEADIKQARKDLDAVNQEKARLENYRDSLVASTNNLEVTLKDLNNRRSDLEKAILELGTAKGDLRANISGLDKLYKDLQSQHQKVENVVMDQKKLLSTSR